VRLVAWNIRSGGGRRLPGIAGALAAHDADVLVLSEFRTRPGAALLEALGTAGWPHAATTAPGGSRNGVAVVSRQPLEALPPPPLPRAEHAERWLELELRGSRFGLTALYVPTMISGLDKPAFWEALLAASAERLDRPWLIAGDLNTGLHGIDERGATVGCADAFQRLLDQGWIDAWRAIHGDRREYSWRSPRRRYGIRLDHAFLSPPLAERLVDCRYSQADREAGLSDHAALVLELAG